MIDTTTKHLNLLTWLVYSYQGVTLYYSELNLMLRVSRDKQEHKFSESKELHDGKLYCIPHANHHVTF